MSHQPGGSRTRTASSSGGSHASSEVGSLPGDSAFQTVHDRMYHRTCSPTDLPACHALEAASYPADEAASLSMLQYRQHHAAPYFRCAVLLPPEAADPTDSMKMRGDIVGFVTGTRTSSFDEASMSVHDPAGPMLAIHSVVVAEGQRRQGIGAAMLAEYVRAVRRMGPKVPIDKIVLIAKAEKLAYYVRAGFSVVGVSPIVHGRDVWYECAVDLAAERRRAREAEAAEEAEAAGEAELAAGAVDGSGSGSGPDGGVGGGIGGGVAGGGGSGGGGGGGAPPLAGRQCYVVDSFGDPARAGSGNPAAVVFMRASDPPPDQIGEREGRWLRAIAREFNLSETAFLWERRGSAPAKARAPPEPSYDIRYYTRSGEEVGLCGHATLAAASVVLRKAPEGTREAVFHAREDVLRAAADPEKEKGGSGAGGKGKTGQSVSALAPASAAAPSLRIVMDFPWRSVRAIDSKKDREAILNMLGSAFPGLQVSEGGGDILHIGMDNLGEDILIELTPDAFGRIEPAEGCEDEMNIAALGVWGGGYTRGVIMCCRASGRDQLGSGDGSGGGVDFLSRFFGPKAGIDEDPVTGSAHCTLAPYFGAKIGRTRVVGKQASARGGIVECVLQDGAGEVEERQRRVSIAGTAVTTVQGRLLI